MTHLILPRLTLTNLYPYRVFEVWFSATWQAAGCVNTYSFASFAM